MYIYGTYNYSYCFCLTKTHNWGGHIISVHYQSFFYPMAVNSSTIPLDSNFFLDELPIFCKILNEIPIFMAFGRWNPNFHGKILNDIPIFMARWMVFMTFSWHFHMSFLASASFRPGQTSSSWESDSCDDGSWENLGQNPGCYKVGPPRSTIAKLGFTSLQFHYGKIHLY